jgi:biopolymer transport protein ExbB
MIRRSLALLLLAAWSGLAIGQAAPPDPLQLLLLEVQQGRAEAARQNEEREQRFLAEKDRQRGLLEEADAALEAERMRTDALQQRFDDNAQRLAELEASMDQRAGHLTELLAVARQAAGEVKAVFDDSLISTQMPDRQRALDELAGASGVPSIAQLETLWLALQQEMTESGKVVTYPAKVVAVDGSEQQRLVTRIGAFNAVAGGTFLRHIPGTSTLEELPRQPPGRYRRLAGALEAGGATTVPMVIDPARGAVLSLLVKTPGLVERIQQGRAIGYVIIAIAIFGLLVGLERLIYLSMVGHRMRRQLGDATPDPKNPLGRLLAVFVDNRHVGNETLELKLDERILGELPKLQRGLQTLRIMAVIAPLLGLLGTVTGLIETFQSITLFGTGDPRLMAGGISQALVTTVLGLTAAIPLILLHTAVSSKARRLVGILEEQGAGLVAEHAERSEGHAVAA